MSEKDQNMEVEALSDDDLESVSGGVQEIINTSGGTCNTSEGRCETSGTGTCNTSGSGTCG